MGDMKTAVLVIDVQRGLCDDPPRPHEAEAVMQRINALTGRARASGRAGRVHPA
jgi:nicotinamidase-related amidase